MRNAPFLWMSWYLLINLMGLVPAVEAQTCVSTTNVCDSCVNPAESSPFGSGYYLTCGTCALCKTTCSNDYYNTGPCTNSADFQRTLCTQCINLVNYQTTACQGGSVTQNRGCSPCSTCSTAGTGTYRTALCNTGADTQCAACTTCTAGSTFETVAC